MPQGLKPIHFSRIIAWNFYMPAGMEKKDLHKTRNEHLPRTKGAALLIVLACIAGFCYLIYAIVEVLRAIFHNDG